MFTYTLKFLFVALFLCEQFFLCLILVWCEKKIEKSVFEDRNYI